MRVRNFWTLVVSCAVLGGCAMSAVESLNAVDPRRLFQEDVNVMEKNYAAADYMAGQARNFLKPGDTIRVLPLMDVQEPRIATMIGRKIPEQVGQRFAQLGYDVDLSPVVTRLAPAYDPVRQPVFKSSDYTLSGDYIRKTAPLSSTLNVRLRLQETGTGRELAAFAYELPRTGDIVGKSRPQATITRTSNQ